MKLKVIEVWCKIQKKNWYKIVQINLQGHLSSSLKRPFLFEITLDFIPEKNGVVQQPRDVWMATEPDLYYPLNQREKIAVRLFRADIWPSDFDKIKVKKHFWSDHAWPVDLIAWRRLAVCSRNVVTTSWDKRKT